MNILFVSYTFPPASSGVGTYVYNMALALCAAGHNVAVATGKVDGLAVEERINGINVYRCYSLEELWSPQVASIILDLAVKVQADVIEGADYLGEVSEILKCRERPLVVTKMHSCNVHSVLSESQAWYKWQRVTISIARLRAFRQTRAELACIEKADAVLSPSHALFDACSRQNIRLPLRRAVVPNPFKIPKHTPAPLKEQSAVPTILFVGRLDMGKGIGYLPSMLKIILSQIPNATLEIAGGDSYARGLGSLRKWLFHRFEKAGVSGRVHWLGHLDSDTLDQAYKRAWIQIIPSRWDTFPGVALEGMARAKALIVSCNGGLPEMMKGTLNIIEDPRSDSFSEGVVRLLSDDKVREQAGYSGYIKLLNDYSPVNVARAYTETIQNWT